VLYVVAIIALILAVPPCMLTVLEVRDRRTRLMAGVRSTPQVQLGEMSVMADPYFETFKNTAGHWRWRLKAGNGRKIATSGEWFTRRADAIRAATTV
jgi:uncharacterized protein YegP (UPF0339 family)